MATSTLAPTASDRRTADAPALTPAPAAPDARHWIGGAWHASARTLPSVNPATGEVLGTFADAGADEAAAAVSSRRATWTWSRSRGAPRPGAPSRPSARGSSSPSRSSWGARRR